MYQAILRSYPAGIVFLCDPSHRFVVVDGRALRQAGIDPARMVGQHIGDVWPPETVAVLEPQLRAALAGQESVQEVPYEGRLWRVRMLPVLDETGVATWALAHARDVTRRRDTEAALAASEQRVRRIIDELPQPVLVLDLDTMAAEFANAEYGKLLGYDVDALLAMGGTLVPSLVHPEDQPFVATRFGALFAAHDGEIVESEFRARHATRGWVWAHTRSIVFARHADGRPRTMLTVATDVSERHAAFAALQDSARRLREAQQIGRMGSWEWDPATGALTWSEAMSRIWGRDPSEPTPDYHQFLETIPEPDRSEMVTTLTAAITGTADTFRLDHRVLRPDGGEPRIQCRGSIRRDANGRATKVTGTSQDVTELRMALEAARDSEARYRQALAITNDAVYDAELVGAPRMVWNEAMRTVFGHDVGPDGISPWDWFNARLHPEDIARTDEIVSAALAGDADAWRMEYRFRKADGQYAVVVDRARIIRDASGTAVRVIGSLTDETARRALEARLRQSAKLDALGTLAGGIAHDFNNILTGIVGFTELAAGDVAPGSDAADSIAEITNATQRARDLVRQILAFSRTDDARRVPVAVAPLIDETHRLLRATFPSTVRIDAQVDPAPDLVVVADASLLQQSLLNLCVNAEHAMRSSAERVLTIALRRERIDATHAAQRGVAPGTYARVSVRDTGHGMTPDVAERVLEPFFTTKPVGEGTGLGLAMVHGTVTAAGGTIEIDSTPGVGTAVTMLLPLAPGARATTRDVTHVPSVPARRVLVVDDEPSIRKVLSRLLERAGHLPIVAASAEQAGALLADATVAIDVLLTDQTMPGQTGDELAALARSLRPALRIVLMTGFSRDLPAARLEELGVAVVLEKPVDSERLVSAIVG